MGFFRPPGWPWRWRACGPGRTSRSSRHQPGNQNARKEKRLGQNKRVDNTFVRGSTNAPYLTARLAPRPPGLHIPPNAYHGLMRDLDKAAEEQAEDAEAHVLGGHGGRREQAST